MSIVIDPEDHAQVERLYRAYTDAAGLAHLSYRVENMRAALRSLLEPPKPPEPMGHLAVVQDADGVRWVSWRDTRYGLDHHERPWQSSQMDTHEWRDYDKIAVDSVLFEGIK